jgi:hypothetical protein
VIKKIIEETMKGMSGKLFPLGLPAFRLSDAALLAEAAILFAFREKLANGKTPELVNLLNGNRSSGNIAFVQNFIQDLAKKSLERSLVSNYRMLLIDKLKMNYTLASQVSQTAMTEITKSMFELFSNIHIDEEDLVKIVDEGLPFHLSISPVLQS